MLLLIQNLIIMKNIIIILLSFSPFVTLAQSETTQRFHKENEDAFVLFAYHNTLKMFAQIDDEQLEELDDLIKDIDKMKFVRVDASKEEANSKIKELASDYKSESFEDLMNMRHDGMNVNVFIKEDDGVTKGIVMLMNDEESISVIDIIGKVPLNKVANLISQVQKMQ